MKQRIAIVTAVVMLVAATAFAAPGDQTGNQNLDQMYQYCNQVMQQWGNGSQSSNGQVPPQGQPMSYSGGMMMGNGTMMGNMMGNGSNGHMMGDVMSNGSYGGMMGRTEI